MPPIDRQFSSSESHIRLIISSGIITLDFHRRERQKCRKRPTLAPKSHSLNPETCLKSRNSLSTVLEIWESCTLWAHQCDLHLNKLNLSLPISIRAGVRNHEGNIGTMVVLGSWVESTIWLSSGSDESNMSSVNLGSDSNESVCINFILRWVGTSHMCLSWVIVKSRNVIWVRVNLTYALDS